MKNFEDKKMKRSRFDIIIDIMDGAKMGANKTRIVYSTNLNFNLANKYIELLQKHGLMEKRSDKYTATDKGKSFLEKAKEITQQLEARRIEPFSSNSMQLKVK